MRADPKKSDRSNLGIDIKFILCSKVSIMPERTTINWAWNIERNREALIRIVTALFAMLGIVGNAVIGRVPRPLHSTVLRVLRPAEAAVRRLIYVMAKDVVLKPQKERTKLVGKIEKKDKGGNRHPLFRLEDIRPPMVPGNAPVRYAKVGPRIINLGPTEPTVAAIFAAHAWQPIPRPAPKPAPIKDGKIDGARLLRRLQAIMGALQNLDREAVRCARWIARRKKISETRLIYVNPIRPGPAPYLHEKPRRETEEVEQILRDCHRLAWEVRGWNTS